MRTYTLKHAIVDLGFIDACCYFGELSMGEGAKEFLLDSIGYIETLVMNGSIAGGAVDPHRNAKLLHRLGEIRGLLWQIPIPHALSEAINRVINFATGDEDFACKIIQYDDMPEPKEHQLSDNQRAVTLETGGNGDDAWSLEFAHSIGAPHLGVLDVWRRLGALTEEEIQEEISKGAVAPNELEVEPKMTVGSEGQEPGSQAGHSPVFPESYDQFNPNGKRGRREWTPEQRTVQAERARNRRKAKPPFDSDLPDVKADWKAGMPFDQIGSKYGCSGGHIRNFLKKHGINPNRGRHSQRRNQVVEQAESLPPQESALKSTPITTEEWPGIQQMLASGKSREAIAGDYDVSVDALNAFIAERLAEVRKRYAN